MEKDKLAQEAADKKFENFVMKQEQTLRVSIYLLLNLSEDIKVCLYRTDIACINLSIIKLVRRYKGLDIFNE